MRSKEEILEALAVVQASADNLSGTVRQHEQSVGIIRALLWVTNSASLEAQKMTDSLPLMKGALMVAARLGMGSRVEVKN